MIAFPLAPLLWAFEDFVYLNSSNPIEDWYNGECEEVQQSFDSLLKGIQKVDQHLNWVGWRGYLKGEAKESKIWEIGFKARGKQYRIFGIFGSKKKHVILLVGCYHKQTIYTPPDAIATAIKRAKALAEGTGTTHARQINTDF